ncbi:hypothetical protein ATCC90586_009459 [Pythium insidiosum]|nr:hypothetical protein ATCC90586_009459 [Pythium insidiosum]
MPSTHDTKSTETYAALESPHAVVDLEPELAPPKHPLDSAGWLSQLTMWWLNPAMRLGFKQSISEDDVWELPASDRSETLQEIFDRHYAAEKQRVAPQQTVPIHWPMWHATKSKMTLAIVLHLLSAAATLLQPLLIKSLLQYFQDEEPMIPIRSGYGLAGLLTATAFGGVTAMDYGMFLTTRSGINARMIVINGVFQKLLRLSTTARQTISSGDVITLAGVDSERLYEAYAIGLWGLLSPLMVATVCVLIGVEMGYVVALVAAACCVLILVYAMTNSREIGRQRRAILQVAGERVKLTNEALQGIRAIKMYAWEDSMLERVRAIRDREIKLVRKYDYLRVNNLVVLSVAQTLMTAACLVAYIYQGETLTVPTAFVLLALTNACRMPFGIFSNAVVFSSEAFGSMQRIAAFFSADEMPVDVLGQQQPSTKVVELQNADFSWTQDAETPTLRQISFAIERGSLTIIVGAVGSGKSSLVNAILGEIQQLRGYRAVRGSVAYASQQAWIQHGSVRDNVLFGADLDSALYDAVLSACQLRRDLEILEHGDATEIGERGINLSGGQKARVSLARAMYRRDAELLLLDDPLSALDVHVANAVFFEGVLGLAKSKTRVLVLNAHYHLLPHADRVVVLADGEIVGDGSYNDVVAAFPHLADQALDAMRPQHEEEEEEEGMTQAHDDKDEPTVLKSTTRRAEEADEPHAPNTKTKQLMLDEERAVGAITWRTYTSFLQNSGVNGVWLGVVLLLAFAIAQGGVVAGDYFLTFWSEGSLQRSQETALWVFVGVVAAATLLLLGRAVLFTEICIRAVQTLHAVYLRKVMYAPVPTFFDVTPVGRILNRFSRDLDQLDNPLPYYSLAMLMFLMLMLAVLLVCAVTTPTTLALYPVLGFACHWVQRYYLSTSRELKRWDGVTRSPFLNLVAETANGLDSIRAFRMAPAFATRCRALLDHNCKFFFLFQSSAKWYAMRLDWLVTSVVTVVSFTCVATQRSIGAASAGIALTYAVQLTLPFQRFLAFSSATENYMTSFERIAHYASLEAEGSSGSHRSSTSSALEITATPDQETHVAEAWPARGAIEFEGVTARYRDGLDIVLRDVSFTVNGGEKIGVCGRTGSGKSTLLNVLFRTLELSRGCIRIDGVDISRLPLATLRSRLTVIPQDPVLFSGSLRENLDPFGDKTDAELFAALRHVQLLERASWGKQGLAYVVAEKGENLSVGERQLICIARALLRDSRIVVLDEATACVDQDLDRLIQSAIKHSLADRTTLTIAHRLETIAESDKVLVMDHGVVAEFDAPAKLLARPDGIFASLMASARRT